MRFAVVFSCIVFSAVLCAQSFPATTHRVLVHGQDITNTLDPSHTLEQQPSVEALK